LDKAFPAKQVTATFVAEQVAAPAGHLTQAELIKEYPVLQVKMVEKDEQVAAFYAQA